MSVIFRSHAILLFFLSSFGIVVVTHADDGKESKQLHNQYCLKCHDPGIYQRPDSFIKSYKMLDQQIRRCEVPAGAQWSPSQMSGVTDYLNSNFYKFEQSK